MIHYDDHKHRYYNDKDETYRSATQLVGLFCEEFDAFHISRSYAKKHGGTPEEWRERWRRTGEQARNKGTRIHLEKEGKLLQRGFHYDLGALRTVYPVVESMYQTPLINWQDGSYNEVKFWSHPHRIAGRADRAEMETRGSHRYLHIGDYKTNEKLEFHSWYNENAHAYKMMKYPVSHLMDCSYYHYELQLSIYMFCGELMGFEPGLMWLIHCPGEEEVPIELEYRKKEVISMLNFANR